MSQPNFSELAEEWVTRLEQEYWENAPCRCKERLAELLKRMYEVGRIDQ